MRLWRPAPRLADPAPPLRGSVQLASGPELHYFESLETLPGLLRELAGWPLPPAAEEPPCSSAA